MSYCFTNTKGKIYNIAYLDATALGGIFFDGLFLTVKTGKHVEITIDEKFKEGFLCFNEEYWIETAKDYIMNDIDYVVFLSEPDTECEEELFLEFIVDNDG